MTSNSGRARGAKNKTRYFIHQDCALAEFTREHKIILKDVIEKKSRRTRTQKKKVHVSEGNVVCQFCHNLIVSGETYVNQDKKSYHNTGRNSCLVRVRRVIGNLKSSLY